MCKDATEILQQLEAGNAAAADQLLPLLYEELRILAKAKLSRENPGQTLDPTALVHEAYVRLVDVKKAYRWHSRGHFFAAAAEAMRRILVERARRKQSLKRGGKWRRVDGLDELENPDFRNAELLALDEAIEKLEQRDPTKADLVKLRFFAGFTIPQAADALGIAPSTADKYWAYAKCWLRVEMEEMPDER